MTDDTPSRPIVPSTASEQAPKAPSETARPATVRLQDFAAGSASRDVLSGIGGLNDTVRKAIGAIEKASAAGKLSDQIQRAIDANERALKPMRALDAIARVDSIMGRVNRLDLATAALARSALGSSALRSAFDALAQSPRVDWTSMAKLRGADLDISAMIRPPAGQFAALGRLSSTSYDAARFFKDADASRSVLGTLGSLHRIDFDHVGRLAADAARVRHWSERIAGRSALDISRLFPSASIVSTHAEAIRRQAQSYLQQYPGGSSARAFAMPRTLEATGLKLSVLAGVQDMYGGHSLPAVEAYRSLLGDWRIDPSLPKSFWLEPSERRRRYERAEVDEGLVEATPAEAIEIMVSSGLTAGSIAGDASTSTVSLGDVRIDVTAPELDAQAHRIVRVIEQRMREFISLKMSVLGPRWFSQRSPGDIVGKAKEKRKAALKAGEPIQPHINFVDIGEIREIVSRADNWEQWFGEVFVEKAKFGQLILTLNTWRRPNAHARDIDVVMFLELFCAARRLEALMNEDGAWKRAAEEDC